MSTKLKQRELTAIRAVRNILEEGRKILERFPTAPDSTEFLKVLKGWSQWRKAVIVALVAKISSEGGGHPDTMVGYRDDASDEFKKGMNELKQLVNRQLKFDDFGLMRIGLKQLGERNQAAISTRIEKILDELLVYGAGPSKTYVEFCTRPNEPANLNSFLLRLKDNISAIDFLLVDVSWLLGMPLKMSLTIKHKGNRHASESRNAERRLKARLYALVRQHKQIGEGPKKLSERLNSTPEVLEAANKAGIEAITIKTVKAALQDGRRLKEKRAEATE